MSTRLTSRQRIWAWIVLAVVAAGTFVIGLTRTPDPHTPQERADSITQQISCPVCNGESAYESQATAARGIRQEVLDLVTAGKLTNDQIVNSIEQKYPGTSLVPGNDGVDALVWILPVVVGLVALGAAWLVLRRWRGAGALSGAWGWAGAFVVVAVGVGWLVADRVGRDPTFAAGATTTTLPADPVARQIALAKSQMGSNPSGAAEVFIGILKDHPDNAQAAGYAGWLVAQQGYQNKDETVIQQGLSLLKRSVEMDPTFGDGHCLLSATAGRLLAVKDLALARTEAQKCIDNGGDPALQPMVTGFLGDSPGTTATGSSAVTAGTATASTATPGTATSGTATSGTAASGTAASSTSTTTGPPRTTSG